MFRPLKMIAESIRREVEQTGQFKKTLYAAVTNAGQLQEILESQTTFPAAVVCIGAVTPGDRNLDRTIRPLIVVFDRYRKGEENRADSVWDMTEAVAARFMIQYDQKNPPWVREVGGVQWEVGQMLPLDSKRQTAAVSLELSGVEVAKIDSQNGDMCNG